MNPTAASISELAKGLRSKQYSAVELIKQSLDAAKQDSLNVFITVNDAALEAARRADKRISSGDPDPLIGIPFAVKDVLMTRGLRTTAASRMLADFIPSYTATAVERLTDRGMVILGKTNCDEFAVGSSNENSAFGPVKNPHDESRVPGGSSGGSAVAVAAGYAPVSLGTDTGGSVRLPAALCGVVGFRPTYGRISRYGLIAMASSLDQVGIFSRNAEDCALLLEAMAGFDRRDATSSREAVPRYRDDIRQPVRPLTIGIPKEYVDDEVGVGADLVRRARERYEQMPNVKLVDVSLPHSAYGLATYYICVSSEISANLARYDGLRYGYREEGAATLEELYRTNRTNGLGSEPKRRILLGTYALSAGYFDKYYAQASKVRRLILQDFEKAFQRVDVLLSPTSPTPAFKLGERMTDPLLMYLSDLYTVGASLAGLPAVSYPAGMVSNLPVGLQLTGPAWSEARLLQAIEYLQPIS